MKQVKAGKTSLEIKHEGERYRFNGELTDNADEVLGTFRARINRTERLTSGRQALPLSEEEKGRIMNLVMKYWPNDGIRICFLNDDLSLICETAPIMKKRRSEGLNLHINLKQLLPAIAAGIGVLIVPVAMLFAEGIALAHVIPLVAAAFGVTAGAGEVVHILLEVLFGIMIGIFFMGIILIMIMASRKREIGLNARFQKHWKKVGIPLVIIMGLMFSLTAAQMLGEIPK